jgi:hypothetical protein
VIRHTITDLIDRSEGEVIWSTYTLFIGSSSNKIASFILYQLTHGPLYQLFRGMAELKSFLICIIEVYDDSFHQPEKQLFVNYQIYYAISLWMDLDIVDISRYYVTVFKLLIL